MKKALSFILAAVMVCTLSVALLCGTASAANSAVITINGLNPEQSLEGSTTIYTVPGTNVSAALYITMAIFEKAENDTYKLVSFFSDAQDDGLKTVPEGGFIVTYNTGNNWPELMANAEKEIEAGTKVPGDFWYYDEAHKTMPNFVTELNEASGAALKGMAVGSVVKIQGIDLAAGTVETNGKERYEEGFISNAVIYYANESAPEKTPIETAPESSEPAPDSSEPAAPDTGDAGMIALVVVAAVAAAGAAVVIKRR